MCAHGEGPLSTTAAAPRSSCPLGKKVAPGPFFNAHYQILRQNYGIGCSFQSLPPAPSKDRLASYALALGEDRPLRIPEISRGWLLGIPDTTLTVTWVGEPEEIWRTQQLYVRLAR